MSNAEIVRFQQVFFDGVGGVDGLNDARGVAASADGKQVFVTGAFDAALAVFDRDAATGELTFRERFIDNTSGI